MLYIAVALIIGFILGAVEGRHAAAKAKEIAVKGDEALHEAISHATAQLHGAIQLADQKAAYEWAQVVADLKSVL